MEDEDEMLDFLTAVENMILKSVDSYLTYDMFLIRLLDN